MLQANIKLILSFAIVIISIFCYNYLDIILNNLNLDTVIDKNNKVKVYSPEELAHYNGLKIKSLYLAVLGTVFDVTKGKKHYSKRASYHYFIGKDGSRAFVTGDFKDESQNKDHVVDLSCNDLFILINWRNTFKDKYIEVGVLNGRYFDKQGKETPYAKELKTRLEQCAIEREMTKKHDQNFPPCNVEWNQEAGTRVWCTKSSGGIQRNWAGVPRQLFTPGESKPYCVCVNTNQKSPLGHLKEYENCLNTSISCIVLTK